jgi:hypothetical protein
MTLEIGRTIGRVASRTRTARVFAGLMFASLLTASGALGQKAGVLIGVVEQSAGEREAQTFEAVHEPKYKTLWIAADASGKLQVLTTIPELIVPRKDGFWHAGVKQVCEFTAGDADDGGNERLNQLFWAAPVGKAGVVEQDPACTPHKPEDYAPPYGRAAGDEKKISQCGFTLADIDFISPAAVSIQNFYTQSEDCEARGGRYTLTNHVYGYESSEAVSFSQLLGQQAAAAYTKAIPEAAHDDNGEECGAPLSGGGDTDWRVGRNAGRWAPFFSQNVGYFGCSADTPIRFRLPSSVTGETAAIVDWKPFRAKEAELEDGFIAPSGDMAIIVTKTEMKFYEVHANVPGELLLTMPGKPIVMVQWSTGTHVADWSAQMVKIAKMPAVEPTVRVKPEAK